MADPIASGTVKSWNDAGGTGVITDKEGRDVFIQRSAVSDGTSLIPGTVVTFLVSWDAAANRLVADMCVGAAGSQHEDTALLGSHTFDQPQLDQPPPPLPPPPQQPQQLQQQAGTDAAGLLHGPESAVALQAAASGGKGSWKGAEAVGDPPPSDNLFISGLPGTTTEESIKSIFGAYGEVISVKVLPEKGRSDRAALLRMGDVAQATWLVENLNGNIPVGLTCSISVRYAARATTTHTTGTSMVGTCKIWITERGMGFIIPQQGGEDYFAHKSDLTVGDTLQQGATVTFEPAWDSIKNKPVAKKVKVVGGAAQTQTQPQPPLPPQPPHHGAAGSMGAPPPPQQAPPPAPPIGANPTKEGVVKVWFEEKGFGFISPSDGGSDAYVHRTMLIGMSALVQGAAVKFTAEWDAMRNRTIARSCSALNGGAQPAAPAAAAVPAPPPLAASPQVLVGGLPATCNDELLKSVFGPYGTLVDCKVLEDTPHGKTAMLQLASVDQATWLVQNLSGNMPVGLSAPITVQFASVAGGGHYGSAAPTMADGRASPY